MKMLVTKVFREIAEKKYPNSCDSRDNARHHKTCLSDGIIFINFSIFQANFYCIYSALKVAISIAVSISLHYPQSLANRFLVFTMRFLFEMTVLFQSPFIVFSLSFVAR